MERWRSYGRLRNFLLALTLLGSTLCACFCEALAQTADSRITEKVADDSSKAAEVASEETSADRQERITAERFLELLKKRPRAGTALDKVYGYHVQRGSLDQFSDALREEAASKNSGQLLLLLGLITMQRGQDAEARVALEKADELLPQEPLASFYLGKTLILLGDFDAAAAALERAVERKPTKADSLQVFQELGRLYQRQRRVEDAVSVWNRMEKLFPGDTQVQEQIAVVLAEEGASLDALARYEKLAKSTKDRYRQIEMAVRAAQLKVTVGRREEALSEFEKVLGQVNPDSWIYQDVRNRIDSSFLTRNDYEGLAAYTAAWIERHPDDIDAMLRIGRLLSIQRRSPEARQWFVKAIEKAPSEEAPRLALIEALERDSELAAAADAMEALVEQKPDNPDYIVRWGELVFNNRAVPEVERSAEASKIWKRLLDKRGDDPVTVARVGDLLRGAGIVDEALAAYRKAIELADSEPQYREYLGEYLFQLRRKDEALAVWRELAAGSRRTRDNLVRLSEVLATFDLDDEALATMAQACELQPTFEQRVRYAAKLRAADKVDAALEQLLKASKLAESPDEHALVLDEQIKSYEASGQLEQQIAAAEQAVAGADEDNADTWKKLALLQEANRKYQQAAVSIGRAAELEPQSIAIQTVAVRVQERGGLFGEAIASLQKLSALDRRFLSNYLTQIASLQMRLGQLDEALKTGRQLISAPGASSEQFRFFADICFQAGKPDQGLETLRRNVRRSPNDREAIQLLAHSLSTQFKTEEAIELYWRFYALSPSLDEKRSAVEALAELYLRTNRFAQLVSRLETSGREENRQREATLLIAAAHQASGDLGAARELLEPLLGDGSRDADLLSTLIKLAQADYDWEAAVEYQKRLNELAPSPEGEYQLAKFLLETGDSEQAESIWLKVSAEFATPDNLAHTIDHLFNAGEDAHAIAVAEQAVLRDPDNWEVLPIAMTALWRSGKRERALELAERLLKLPVASDTRSSAAKRLAATQPTQRTNGATNAATAGSSLVQSGYLQPTRSAWLFRTRQNLARLSNQSLDPFGSQRTLPGLMITTFEDAKALAFGVKRLAQPRTPQEEERWLQEQLASDDPEALWMAAALLQVSSAPRLVTIPMTSTVGNTTTTVMRTATISPGSPASSIRVLERLAEMNNVEACAQLLSMFYSSRMTQNRSAPVGISLVPLGEAELERLNRLYKNSNAALPAATSTRSPATALWLAEEFKSAGRDEEAKSYLDDAVAIMDANPSAAHAISLLTLDRKRAVRYFVQHTFQNVQSGSKASPAAATAPYQTAGFVTRLLQDPSEGSGDIIDFVTELKRHQVAFTKQLRPSQLADYDPKQQFQQTVTTYAYGTGGVTATVQVDFPAPSAFQSIDLLVSLRVIHSATKDPNQSAVAERLEEDAKMPDEDVFTSAIDRLCYACWLWWSGDKPAALEQTKKFGELAVGKELAAILQSRMLYELGQVDEALTMLESFKPLNQQMLQERELAILQLALQKEDKVRAKQSAERLFALRLPTNVQLQVANVMHQLDMKEMADSIMRRARSRSSSDVSSQVQLMTQLIAMKDSQGASEIARQILRRTRPKQTGSNPFSAARNSDDSARQSAVRHLVNTGEARTMIASLQERLQRSPNSQQIIAGLAELYGATGQSAQSQEMLGRLAKSTPRDAQSMVATARILTQRGKHAEAVDQYLAAFEKQPELFTREYAPFRSAVQRSNRWKQVAEQFQRIGIAKFPADYRMTQLINDLITNREPEAAKVIIKALSKEYGLAVQIDLTGITNAKLVDDELRGLTFEQVSAIIDSQAGLSPFFLSQPRRTSSGGHVHGTLTVLQRTFDGDANYVAKLIEKLEPGATKDPSRVVLLASLYAIDKQYHRAMDAFKPLLKLSDREQESLLPAVWEFASLLAFELGQPDRAIEILEPWVATKVGSQANQGQLLDTTMKGVLFHCYTQTRQLAKAKAILDKEMVDISANASGTTAGSTTTSSGFGGMSYTDMPTYQARVRAVQQYLDIEEPFESLRLIHLLRSDLRTSGTMMSMSGSAEVYERQLDQLERSAKSRAGSFPLERLIETLTKGADRSSVESLRAYPAFLLVPESDTRSGGQRKLTCLFLEALEKSQSNGAYPDRITKAFSHAADHGVSEQTITGLVCLICLADTLGMPERLPALATALRERLAAQPSSPAESSEALAAARTALARDEQAAVWLAIDCLKRRDQKELALGLAQAGDSLAAGPEGRGLGQISLRLELAQLRLELGQSEAPEKELRGILDTLLPP